MAPLDPLLGGSRQKLARFFAQIVEMFPENLDDSTELPAKLEVHPESIGVVHSFLEEPNSLTEMDDAITKHADLGLDQHTPLKLRSAISKCPPLPPRVTGAPRISSDDTTGVSPSHSPRVFCSFNCSCQPCFIFFCFLQGSPAVHRHRAAPSPPPLVAAHSVSASDLGPHPARRWSSSRSASASALSESGDEHKSPQRLLAAPLRTSSGRRTSDAEKTPAKSPVDPEKKSPRLFQNVQKLLKKEPDHDEGYVSTIFSEEYNPDEN